MMGPFAAVHYATNSSSLGPHNRTLIHPRYKDLLGINVNKSRQEEGLYSQTKLPGLIPRTRREKLLEREVFAMPSSLSTGPLTNLSAGITAFSACYT